MLCLYFLCSNLKKLYGLTYIHPYPQHIVETYGYSPTCHVWKVPCLSSEWVWQLIPHLAGQLLLLFV